MSHSLESEHDTHFVIRDGKGTFKVPKKGLGESMLRRIRSMGAQRMADGGEAAPMQSEAGALASYGPPPEAPPAAPGAMDTVAPPQPEQIQFQQIPLGPPAGMPNVDPKAMAVTGMLDQAYTDPTVYPKAYARQLASEDWFSWLPAGVKRQGVEAPAGAKSAETKPATVAAAPSKATSASVKMSATGRPSAGGALGVAVPKEPGEAEFEKQMTAEDQAAKAMEAAEIAKGTAIAEGAIAQQEVLQKYAQQQAETQARAKIKADEAMLRVKQASDEIQKMDMTVDPGRFWASRSTPGKITAIIGLALGAVGAAGDGVNRSVALLNQAIDRDLEAQKAEHTLRLQKGESALRAAQNMYSMQRMANEDDIAANAAAKATALDLAAAKLKQSIAGTDNQQAKANGTAMLAKIQAERAKHQQDVYQRNYDNALKLGHLKVEQMQAATQRESLGLQRLRMEASMAAKEGVKPMDRESFRKVADTDFNTQLGEQYLDQLNEIFKTAGATGNWMENKKRARKLLNNWAKASSKSLDPNSAVLLAEIESELNSLGFEAGSPDLFKMAPSLFAKAKEDLQGIRTLRRKVHGLSPDEPLRGIQVQQPAAAAEE